MHHCLRGMDAPVCVLVCIGDLVQVRVCWCVYTCVDVSVGVGVWVLAGAPAYTCTFVVMCGFT